MSSGICIPRYVKNACENAWQKQASKLSRPINVFPKPKQSKTSDPPRFFQNYLTPINVFNMDARTSVSNQARLHFLPVETALTRNWHSPRSHSGTLSSRKRSGSPGGEKPRRESHFTRNVEPPIFAKPIFLLQRVNHKIDLFSFVSFFSFFFLLHGCQSRSRRIAGEPFILVYSSQRFCSDLLSFMIFSILIIIRRNLKNIGSSRNILVHFF